MPIWTALKRNRRPLIIMEAQWRARSRSLRLVRRQIGPI